MNKTLLAWVLTGFSLVLNAAVAGTVTGIEWAPGPSPVLEIHLSGSASYTVKTLAHGLRLRVRLPGSVLGPNVGDLGANGDVKGVYPYLADGGKTINVDVLMKSPGALRVTETPGLLSAAVLSRAGTPAQAGEAVNGQVNELTSMSYSRLPGDQIQLRLGISGQVVKPVTFRIDSPPSIVLDFPHTRLAVTKPELQIGAGAVVRAVAVGAGNRTRIVLTLVKNAPYSTFKGQHSISLLIQNPATAISGATTGPRVVHFAAPAAEGKQRITNVNFKRGPEGDGLVTVRLSNSKVGINITRRHGQVIVDFLDTRVPGPLQRQLNVGDFATPVQTIDTFPRGRDTRMIIKPSGAFEQLAYQTGRKFTVDVKPVTAAATIARHRKYTGKKISMNFNRISVRSALQVLADFTHLNFVTSNSVSGNLTLRLENVPWDQALAIILDSKGLAMRRVGTVIMVGPQKEMAAEEKAKLEAEQQAAKLQPLESVLIRINYAKAADIAALLKSIKPVNSAPSHFMPFSNVNYSKVTTESNSLLSPRGQVTVDPRTNSLLIQDIPSKIREIRKLIAQLDQPVQQVLIEARLVEA
ncbi:MAG: AMIN domain-containing protein, partial [Acidiferrobacteraceae bacterium]